PLSVASSSCRPSSCPPQAANSTISSHGSAPRGATLWTYTPTPKIATPAHGDQAPSVSAAEPATGPACGSPTSSAPATIPIPPRPEAARAGDGPAQRQVDGRQGQQRTGQEGDQRRDRQPQRRRLLRAMGEEGDRRDHPGGEHRQQVAAGTEAVGQELQRADQR